MRRFAALVAGCALMTTAMAVFAQTLAPGFGRARPGLAYVTACGIELVYILPGEYLRGSAPEEKSWAIARGIGPSYVRREGPQPQKTRIDQGFWLGRTEVTVAQWRQFSSATSYVTDAEKLGMKDENWHNPRKGFLLKNNHPATCISWKDAVAFCKWLNEMEQKSGRLPVGHTIRLPIEAEWEYACRAGTQTYFWWGNTIEEGRGRTNCAGKENGEGFFATVDRNPVRGRNKFGLADMLGNVWELCLDGFDGKTPHEDLWTGDAVTHVKRGGGYNSIPASTRCAYRAPEDMPARNFNGFRVCCGVPR